jgi:hypothetical protein
MQNDKLHIWRLSNDVSVVNAAILIVGGDPSTKDQIENYSYNDYSPFFEKRTEGHEGFEAAFSALRAAIQNGQLNAKLHYPAKKETYHAGDDTYDYCLVSSKSIAAKFSDDSVSEHMELLASGSVSVGRKPNWSESLIAVSDLKAWLFSRGFTSGFFFRNCPAWLDVPWQ